MKKDIGSVLALYPMPIIVVGAMVKGKPNWVLVGHHGIMGHDHLMVSLVNNHYTNIGIHEMKVLSVNLVSEEMLEKADLVGSISGHKEDKSEIFSYSIGEEGAPLIDESPISMECTVEDIYRTKGFESFILQIARTYANEDILNENGKLSYEKFKPVLFEMPTYTYLKTGETLGQCKSLHKE